MSFLHLPERFSDDCAAADLSDAAYRLHVEGLCWARQRPPGEVLTEFELLELGGGSHPTASATELVVAGFWSRTDRGYLPAHPGTTAATEVPC